MVTLATKAATYLLQHHDRKDQLLIERGIGYWISPEGTFVPLPPRVSHADIMRALIDAGALNEVDREAFTVDVNAFAIERGWSRVRIYPSQKLAYVDFGRHRQQQHDPAVRDLLEQLELSDVRIKFTDEEGNDISPA